MVRQGACRLIGPMAPTARQNGRPGVAKPWGWEMLWTLTPRYAGKILYIRRGQQISLQYHREKEESFFVRSGRLIFVLEDRRGDRDPGRGAGDAEGERVVIGIVRRHRKLHTGPLVHRD